MGMPPFVWRGNKTYPFLRHVPLLLGKQVFALCVSKG